MNARRSSELRSTHVLLAFALTAACVAPCIAGVIMAGCSGADGDPAPVAVEAGADSAPIVPCTVDGGSQ